MMQNDTFQAVLRTVAYARVFGDTLTFLQLHRWLMGSRFVLERDIKDVLKREHPLWEYVTFQKEKELQNQVVQEKWRSVWVLVNTLSWIPWIQSIWITGGLAVGNVRDQDDIDVLFITDEKRLWLTRALVVVLSLIQGKYRYRGLSPQNLRNTWCCNLWLESSQLDIFSQRQSLYIARELIQAVPVYRRNNESAAKLLLQNAWTKKWSANGTRAATRRAYHCPTAPLPMISLFMRLPVFDSFWRVLNFWCFMLQNISVKKHQTTEEVHFSRALFHPRDTEALVLKKYMQICQKYGILPLP